MKKNTIFLAFTLLFFPIYIFWTPIYEYFYNYGEVTYNMSIPSQSSEYLLDNKDIKINSNLNKNIKNNIEKEIIESWIVYYPNIVEKKDLEKFNKDLKRLNIKTFFIVSKKNKNNIISVGPYIDKSMAAYMNNKINKNIKIKGTILRITN